MSSAFDPGMVSAKSVGPGLEGENPSSEADFRFRSGGRLKVLGCPLESLFDPRSGDDVVAIAEAEGRLQRTLLIPEVVEALAKALELGGGCGVVPF